MQISRIELYELVSKSPLSKVAPTFGISVTILAAICRKHGVPYPGSGYWTRKSLGQAVVLEPLPRAMPEERPINIEPAKRRTLRTQVQTADTTAEVPNTAGQIAPSNDVPMAKERRAEPHSIIAKWLANHERRRREAALSRDPWRSQMAPAPLSDLDLRRHRILGALFYALESRGAKVSEGEKGLLRVTIDGENIDFQIREKNRQVKISPENRRSSYLSQELIGTGKLVFAIRTYLRGPHNEEWRETDQNPLENQLPKIVDRLFDGARVLKEWHIEQEQERERWRQAAAQKAERERLAKQEQKRREKLSELACNWHTANQIRNFIAAIKSNPFDSEREVSGRGLAEWLTWAEATADALDITRDGPERLFSMIGSVKIEQGWN